MSQSCQSDTREGVKMSDKKLTVPKKTVITTGKGSQKTVISAQTQVSSSTGKVVRGDNQVDVALVFDTTGSMADKIANLVKACQQFVGEGQSLGLDLQFALISFGDISVQDGGDKIEVVVPLTEDIHRIQEGLSNIPQNNGFGNTGESSLEAIEKALEFSYRPKAVKVIILITDEPALQHRISADQMIGRLRQREFLVFAIATADQYYKEMGYKTGGDWKEISPRTDLAEILARFREMAKKASQVAKEVHRLGEGSVKKYLALKPPEKT